MLKQYLEIGQIVSTHGVKGELRVNPWCDSPEFMKKFKTLYFDSSEEFRTECARIRLLADRIYRREIPDIGRIL